METNTCYCCGRPTEKSYYVSGRLRAWLCNECKGAKLDRSGFHCPTHRTPEPIDVENVRYPAKVAFTRDERHEWLLFYDECLPEKQ